jgi:hypothetical protein
VGVLKYKARGATLMEALVAIIVVMLGFVMGTMIYVNVMDSDKGFKKLEAASMVREIVAQTKSGDDFIEGKVTKDSITVVKSVVSYPNVPSLMILSVDAFDIKGYKLCTYNEIITR